MESNKENTNQEVQPQVETPKKDTASKIATGFGILVGLIVWTAIEGLIGFIVGAIAGGLVSVILSPIFHWLASLFKKEEAK